MSRVGSKYQGPINPDRRLHIIAVVSTILATGRPTAFRFEGAARHGLRARFCLEGLGWGVADDVAADIVGMALRRVGAQRPKWEEGQPRWTDEGWQPTVYVKCQRCSRTLEDNITEQGWHLRFCSNRCRVAYRLANEERTQAEYWDAMRAAGEVRKLQRVTTCADPACAKEFIPSKPADPRKPDALRYCSPSCSKRHYFKRVAAGELPPQKKAGTKKKPKLQLSCMDCGRMYGTTDPSRQYCGRDCANRAIAKQRRQPFLGPDVKPLVTPEPAPVSRFQCVAALNPEEMQRRAGVMASRMAAE